MSEKFTSCLYTLLNILKNKQIKLGSNFADVNLMLTYFEGLTMKTKILGAIAATTLFISTSSQAAMIGVFGASTADAIDVATGLGHTAEVVTDFSSLAYRLTTWFGD